jgi:signal transduction histidine kinase
VIPCKSVDLLEDTRWRSIERMRLHDLVDTACALSWIVEHLCTAESKSRMPADLSEMVELMRAGSHTLSEEIPNLQLFLDAEAASTSPVRERVTTREAIEEAVHVASSWHCAKGKNIVPTLPRRGQALVSDPALLGGILQNLLRNALEATSVDGEVRITCEMQLKRYAFSIWHAGAIPENMRANLLKGVFAHWAPRPLLRVYCSMLLAEACLGGHISFTSSAGAGTKFSVVVPIA